MELNRNDSRHWPFFGSVLDYLDDQDDPGRRLPEVPRTLHVPWAQSTRSHPHQRAGLFAGFLGPRYNPVVAEYSLTSDWDDRWRTGGTVDEVVAEAHLSPDHLLAGIERFAADRKRRLERLRVAVDAALAE